MKNKETVSKNTRPALAPASRRPRSLEPLTSACEAKSLASSLSLRRVLGFCNMQVCYQRFC